MDPILQQAIHKSLLANPCLSTASAKNFIDYIAILLNRDINATQMQTDLAEFLTHSELFVMWYEPEQLLARANSD
jgi:hypothetical protein